MSLTLHVLLKKTKVSSDNVGLHLLHSITAGEDKIIYKNVFIHI